MSMYGAGQCKLCGAVDDYCVVKFTRGVDIDCRFIVDEITDEQAANLRAMITPEWWEEEQKRK